MSKRYQIRPSHGEGLPVMYGVWDAQNRLLVTSFTREVLAEAAVRRLEQELGAEHRARLARVGAEDGAW